MSRIASLLFVPVCLVGGAACWKDNPAFGLDGGASDGAGVTGLVSATGDEATSSVVTAPTSGDAGSASSTDGQATTSTTGGATASDSGTSPLPDTSTSADDTTGDSGATTGTTGVQSTGDSTGEEPDLCMGDVVGEPPRLAVKQNGQLLQPCGGAKSLTGAFAKFSGSTLQIYDSGTCEQAGALYEVTGVGFTLEPTNLSDDCSSVRIEWAPAPPCEVTGFGLANGEQPRLVGAFGRTIGPTGFAAFSPAPEFACGCEVDDITCCQQVLENEPQAYQPGHYTLDFPGASDGCDPQESIAGVVDGNDYLFTNLRSFVHGTCEENPDHVWLDVRWWTRGID